jgi:hypothetical protein
MMKLWERNDAPPHVDGAPGAAAAHPYLVLCHRPPEEAASSVRDSALHDQDGHAHDGTESHERFGLDERDRVSDHTAVVYQWVRIATELLAR